MAPSRSLVEITFADPVTADEFTTVPGTSDLTVAGNVLRCRLTGTPDALLRAATRHTVTRLLATEPALDDLFHTFYAGAEHAA